MSKYSPEVIARVEAELVKVRERLLDTYTLWDRAEKNPDKCVCDDCDNPPANGIMYCSEDFRKAGYD